MGIRKRAIMMLYTWLLTHGSPTRGHYDVIYMTIDTWVTNKGPLWCYIYMTIDTWVPNKGPLWCYIHDYWQMGHQQGAIMILYTWLLTHGSPTRGHYDVIYMTIDTWSPTRGHYDVIYMTIDTWVTNKGPLWCYIHDYWHMGHQQEAIMMLYTWLLTHGSPTKGHYDVIYMTIDIWANNKWPLSCYIHDYWHMGHQQGTIMMLYTWLLTHGSPTRGHYDVIYMTIDIWVTNKGPLWCYIHDYWHMGHQQGAIMMLYTWLLTHGSPTRGHYDVIYIWLLTHGSPARGHYDVIYMTIDSWVTRKGSLSYYLQNYWHIGHCKVAQVAVTIYRTIDICLTGRGLLW